MQTAVIDTDILSMFFRGNSDVVARFASYLEQHNRINISILTYYEILSGLIHKKAKKQLKSFHDFASRCNIFEMTKESVKCSATIYAELRSRGTPIDDIDILIAGIAIENSSILVTHNTRHFEQISGLSIEDWSETR